MRRIVCIDHVRRLNGVLAAWLAMSWSGAAEVATSAAVGVESGADSGWVALAPAPAPGGPGAVGFRVLDAASLGVGFTNVLSDLAAAANRTLENGSGVALGDYDGDGRPDIFLGGLAGNSALFRNLGGWRFTNVTDSVGLRLGNEVVRGAVFADLDGDRRLDLLVSTLTNGVRCWHNDGGHLSEVTAEAGTGGGGGAMSMALADVDGNGTLDLYVARYRAEDVRDNSNVEARRVGGRTELHPKYAGRLEVGSRGLVEYGEPDRLYSNDGKGRFREVAWNSGVFLDEDGRSLTSAPRDWGLSAAFRDVDGDGLPDLYVCNDYWTPDRCWLNAGGGKFRAVGASVFRHTPENSMGVDFADVDRDGRMDLLVLDMLNRDPAVRRRQALAQSPRSVVPGDVSGRPQYMRNALFWNRGDGTFAEVAAFAGLAASDWSWQPMFLDVDLDGFEDVVIAAGHRRDVQDLDATERIRSLQHPWPAGQTPAARQEAFTRELAEHGRLYPSGESPMVAFRNLGGLRFEEVTSRWGLGAVGVHQGVAMGDLDGDGDQDLVVNDLNASVRMLRNESAAGRVAVRLSGRPPNTGGVGARVRFRSGHLPEQTQEMAAGGRYLSGAEMLLVFAAEAGVANGGELEVRWRGGAISIVRGVQPGRLYSVEETGVAPEPPRRSAAEAGVGPWFEDWSDRLAHRHEDSAYDDWVRQPLLPRQFSQGGPGLAVGDFNGDGFEDLAVGGGTRGRPGVFTNDTLGGFRAVVGEWGGKVWSREQTGLVVWPGAGGIDHPVVGVSDYEAAVPGDGGVVEAGPTAVLTRLTVEPGNVGPLALGDLDGDGIPDLLVGGGVVGGRYPEAGASQVYLRRGTGWEKDVVAERVLHGVGIVNAAVWADLDGDGPVDLALACDWGPIRVFRNERGKLVEKTREWGLEAATGWWQSLTAGDLDGDGRLDLVAGNWGLNDLPVPVGKGGDERVVEYGDLLERGGVDVLEGEWDPARRAWFPRLRLDDIQAGLPSVRARVGTHREYSELSLDECVRRMGRGTKRLAARVLASSAFLNRGQRFEAVDLPREAQFSPMMGVVVADFDGDGREDLFAAQNFFALPSSSVRQDGGQGLVLRGRGDGRWEPLNAVESGVRIEGEQRGVAVADFDRDGRVDLVVGQNAGKTKVYHNRGAAVGLRVWVDGGSGNPRGIGAVVRLRGRGGPGPARPVLAGSGRWSQSGTTLVLAVSGGAEAVVVKWPDGATTESPIPAGASEIRVRR